VQLRSNGDAWFPGDGILSDLDLDCVSLYDEFRDRIFVDVYNYYRVLRTLPIWVREAGLNSDDGIGRNDFDVLLKEASAVEKAGAKITPELLSRYLYLADCHSLIAAIQNRSIQVKWDLVSFFRELADLKPSSRPSLNEDEGVYWISADGPPSRLFASLTSGIVKLYSILDLTTKVAVELHSLATDFSRYPRLKSRPVLYGGSSLKELSPTDSSQRNFKRLLVLRNDLIHSGGWEPSPKVFYRIKASIIDEKWILLPDCDESGTTETYNNRRLFFSRGQKANVEFPELCFAVCGCALRRRDRRVSARILRDIAIARCCRRWGRSASRSAVQ
jgi:hypothetical protein